MRTDSQPKSGLPVTELLQAWRRGEAAADEKLLALVYGELKRLAAAQLRGERQGHTLQPTALVHEAYLRLMKQHSVAWQNRAQFFALASQIMRRTLVDHARARHAAKRPGAGTRVQVDFEAAAAPPGSNEVDLHALDEALDQLAAADPRQARIVELRFFGGLSHEEVAAVLDVSLATVNRDWRMARAWLYRRLTPDDPP